MKYVVAALFVLLAFISWTLFRFERNAQFGSTRLAVNANADNRQPCSPNIKPSIDNIDDYDWVYCTSDLGPFWASLNITENEFTNSSSIFEAASTFGDLDRDGNDERILRLTLGTSMIRFVVLKHVATNGRNVWKTLAHLDISNFHLAPEARVVSNGRGSWIAISNDEKGWGTGILQENETWYELTNGRLIQALSFTEEFDETWVARPTIHRKVKAEASTLPFDGKMDRVDVVFKAEFGWGDVDGDPTVAAGRKVSFAKDPGSPKFQFDVANSETSEAIYLAVCNLDDNFTYDVLVDFAHDEFVKLASGTDEERQRVREVLPELTRSKHEPELIRLLSQHKSK